MLRVDNKSWWRLCVRFQVVPLTQMPPRMWNNEDLLSLLSFYLSIDSILKPHQAKHLCLDITDELLFLSAVAKSESLAATNPFTAKQNLLMFHSLFCLYQQILLLFMLNDNLINAHHVVWPQGFRTICTRECPPCTEMQRSPFVQASSHLQASLCVLQGSVWNDCLYGCCCYPLSWLQISRELKRRAATHVSSSSSSSSSSSARYTALTSLQGAHLI